MNVWKMGVERILIETIIAEMQRGNFSFLILVVGVAQLIVMLRNSRKN